jgi:hypothetical protein
LLFGATSYGMLATKMAYNEGFTTAEITIPSQFVLGIGRIDYQPVSKKIINKRKQTLKASKKNIFHLMLAGNFLRMTSVFYYLTKIYSCSIGIVLLMQTV